MITKWSIFKLFLFLPICLLLSGCDSGSSKNELPVYGEITTDFHLKNQDNQDVDISVVKDKIYVTDFFFTTCPSICPIMKRQMLRVYEAFEDSPDVLLLSHTIDPEHDTVEVLKNFSEGLGIQTEKWQMVTGEQDEIFGLAKHYMLAAMKNDDSPGGYIHSGSFVLIDQNKKIRGYYDGTNKQEVDQLISDLKQLTDKS